MIVISNPTPIDNEINLIHSLFEEGLQLFHVRKPDFSETEMEAFLMEIGIGYRKRLVLHSCHQLAEKFGINSIHFTEKMRKETSEEELIRWKEKGFQLTTSVHGISDFNSLSTVFEYAFLSPIFPSISKKNYLPSYDFSIETAINKFSSYEEKAVPDAPRQRPFFSEEIKKRTNLITRLVALGGISSENMPTAITIGFDDVALLGTIWNSSNPTANFKLCQQIALSYSL